jgi:hypothetical protein
MFDEKDHAFTICACVSHVKEPMQVVNQ